MNLFQSFRAARWLRSINLLLQAILFVTLFAGLNYIARYNSWRFDLTQLRRHSLSAETHAYLKNLGSSQPADQPLVIQLINTFPQDTAPADPDAPADLDQINRDIAALIREYTYALEPNRNVRLEIKNIDVYQNPPQAKLLALKPYTLTLITGAPPDEHRRELTKDDLYQTKNNQRTAFLGEQALTAAILAITNPEKKKIYFLTGHGEMDINNTSTDRGLSEIRIALLEQGYTLDTLDLPRAPAIPPDADLLISIGATTRYEPYEQEFLRNYMTARAGRIILCATPGTPSPDGLTGLENLLAEWGILVDNTWVYDPASTNQQSGYGNLILSNFTPHDVTKPLIDSQRVLLFGSTRPARPDPARAADPGLSITPLVLTGTAAYGVRNYQQQRRIPRYDPAVDLPGPLPVVTVAERVAAKNNLPFSVPVGRIIAFGCSDFVANGLLRSGANNALFFSAVNWLVERDPKLNIPARPIEKFQLTLTHDQLDRLWYMLMFGVPGIFALIGLIVYWTRRR